MMETRKFSDIQIRACIVPRRLRWPESGSSVAWTRAHDYVDDLQDLVRKVDRDCSEAEQNRELSANAIRQRSAAIGKQALRKLVNFRLFEVAEKAVTENIDVLERLSDRDPAQVQMLQKLTHALQDLQEGVQSTKRMVLDRCKMREVIIAWRDFRSIKQKASIAT